MAEAAERQDRHRHGLARQTTGARERRTRAARATLRGITLRQGKLPRTITIEDHGRRLRLLRVDEKVPHSREIADGVRILGDAELIIAPSTLSVATSERRFLAKGRAPGADQDRENAPHYLADRGSYVG